MLRLVLRNLSYYRRTNAAVVLGVGVAVAVLAGALLVGESVRASLRGLFLQRLGRATHVASAPNFFRERLSEDVSASGGFREAGFDAACPLIVAEGVVTHEPSGRRAVAAQVYGVDARFWELHGRPDAAARAPRSDEALLSPSLAAELGAAAGARCPTQSSPRSAKKPSAACSKRLRLMERLLAGLSHLSSPRTGRSFRAWC